jgi:hypothetical protein
MTNFVVSYDLNGPRPSHHEMDQHLEKLGAIHARVLETVWYVRSENETAVTLRDHIGQILGPEDQLLVVRCSTAAWRNLLVTSASLKAAWEA